MSVLEIKALVRFRDGNRCTECGLTNEEHLERYGRLLEVHRLTPGSPYSVKECVTLCKPCHGPKPKRPRGTYPKENTRYVGISLALYQAIQEYADEHSTEDDQKSITWAAKRLIRIGLASEGQGEDPRKDELPRPQPH